MRIYGPNGTTLGTPTSTERRPRSSGFSLPDDVGTTSETRATVAPKADRQYRRAAGDAGHRGGPDRAAQAFGSARQARARRARRSQAQSAVRQSRRGHGAAAARCRRQSEVVFRRSRAWMRCCPRSSCGSRSSSPRPGKSLVVRSTCRLASLTKERPSRRSTCAARRSGVARPALPSDCVSAQSRRDRRRRPASAERQDRIFHRHRHGRDRRGA